MSSVNLEITRREPYQGGCEFGEVGAYEISEGVAHFAVDPEHPVNRPIVDLQLAPRGASGLAKGSDRELVEFRASFRIIAPKEMSRGNGRVLQDVPNRGRHLSLGLFNRAVGQAALNDPLYPGDGYLFEKGYTIATVGWQHGVRPEEGFWMEAPPGLLTLGFGNAKLHRGLAAGTAMGPQMSFRAAPASHRR